MIGPTSLILGYRERAIGTGISIVPPIGASSFGVCVVFYPRRCSGLTAPSNNRDQDGAGQREGMAHSSLLIDTYRVGRTKIRHQRGAARICVFPIHQIEPWQVASADE